MRLHPLLGFGFAVLVLGIWLYFGTMDQPSPPGAGSPAGAEGPATSAPYPPAPASAISAAGGAVALVAAGDRHGDGPTAGLVRGLIAQERADDRRITFLDRVTEAEAPRVLGRLARTGWPVILVEGERLVAAARILAETRPDIRVVLVGDAAGAGAAAVADSHLMSLAFRDWEVAALAGVTAALASRSGRIAFLDLASGAGPAESFEKGARAVVPGIDRVKIERPRTREATGDVEARALVEGLKAQGVDVLLIRGPQSILTGLCRVLTDDPVHVILWPTAASPLAGGGAGPDAAPVSAGSDAASAAGWASAGVLAWIDQDLPRLLAGLDQALAEDDTTATVPSRRVTLGLAEGAQNLRLNTAVADRVLSATARADIDRYRVGLAEEGARRP